MFVEVVDDFDWGAYLREGEETFSTIYADSDVSPNIHLQTLQKGIVKFIKSCTVFHIFICIFASKWLVCKDKLSWRGVPANLADISESSQANGKKKERDHCHERQCIMS